MRYPLPTKPLALCFQGRASFYVESTDIGETCVVVHCDATGRILCWCLAPSVQLSLAGLADQQIRCEGMLVDGRPFTCTHMQWVNWPSEGVPPDAIALRASRFVVGREEPGQDWTFSLTNLLLQNFSIDDQPGRVTLRDHDIAATLSPGPDYAIRMNYLRAYKGIDVTATLRLSSVPPGRDLRVVAQDVCLVLSVLTGHRVNWVARHANTTLVFEDRITKPCSGWPVLGRFDKALGKEWSWQDLLVSASQALPFFEQHAAAYRLRCGLVDSWVDARIETDFLETRGLKTVAVLEMIKSAHRDHFNLQGKFYDLLVCVYNDLGLTVPAELTTITEIRNSLVHEGRFLPAKMEDVQQYELLSHHTDRLVLALIGHQV